MWLFGPSRRDVLDAIAAFADRLHVLAKAEFIRAGHYSTELTAIQKQLARVESKVDRILMNQVVPGSLTLTLIGEMDMLRFQVQLPAPPTGPNDIVAGELLVTVNGAALAPVNVPKDDVVVADESFLGPDGADVHLEFRYIDDAGNKSQASVLDAVLLDTINPAAPGVLGLVAVEEIFQGETGPTGEPGPTGAVGPTGAAGPTGS